jgi:hypothetical protein
MTLHDYFAGQAIVGIVSGYILANTPILEADKLADAAGAVADAMMRRRG